MRILFIRDDYVLWYPVGILYLSGSLRKAGHETRLAYGNHADFLDVVAEYKPNVLAYYVTTGFHRKYISLNSRIKRELPELNAFSVFGGPHATFFPEMIEEPDVDAVCRGEGEIAFLELVDRLAKNSDYEKSPNFWVKTPQGIVKNPIAHLVEDLDSLPYPDHDLVYNADPLTDRVSAKVFFPIRGCPYKCTYCFNHSIHKLYEGKGSWVRAHSVDYVLNDMERVKTAHPMKFVRLVSDTFNLIPEWLEEFRDKYPKRIGVPFTANVRAKLVTDRMARNLAEAGCMWACMGVESGVDWYRNELLKRGDTREQITSAAKLLHKHGIRIITQNIVGLPGETFEEALESMKLAAECEPDYAWAAIYTPYPRTDLAEYARKEGYYDGNPDFVLKDFYTQSALKFRRPGDKARIENLHKLFGLLVEFPALRPLAGTLAGLPLTTLYSLLHTVWWGYAQNKRLMPYKIGMGDYMRTVIRFMQKCHY